MIFGSTARCMCIVYTFLSFFHDANSGLNAENGAGYFKLIH